MFIEIVNFMQTMVQLWFGWYVNKTAYQLNIQCQINLHGFELYAAYSFLFTAHSALHGRQKKSIYIYTHWTLY